MKFKDLPFKIQVIAAQTLSSKLSQSGLSVVGKTEPAKELAREIRNAFVELYSPSDSGAIITDKSPLYIGGDSIIEGGLTANSIDGIVKSVHP